MPGSLRFRLSALMFLQYCSLGLWCVTLATFLKATPHEGGLNFTGQQVAWLYSTFAIAAAISPLLAGLLADRFFPTQKVLAVLHFIGAVLLVLAFRTSVEHQSNSDLIFRKIAFAERVGDEELWHRLWELQSIDSYLRSPNSVPSTTSVAISPLLKRVMDFLGVRPTSAVNLTFPRKWTSPAEAMSRRDVLIEMTAPVLARARRSEELAAECNLAFRTLFWLLLAYNLCYLPSVTLANALCFRNLPEPGRQFGQARVFGTLGWIAAGLFIGWTLPAVSPIPLLLAAAVSGVLSLLCLALPHTPPLAHSKHIADLLGLPALRMFANRSFLVFALTSLSCSVLMAFHNVFANPFLVDLHVEHSAAVQTLGQTTEILGILLIPVLRHRLGFRWVLTLGLATSAIRFFGYASGSIPVVLAVGLPMHGFGFSLFYITAAIYVDLQSPGDLRASAQGLITQLTSGVGALAGIALSGFTIDALTVNGTVDWRTVWLIPALGTVGIALIFAVLFREPVRRDRPVDEAERIPAPRIGETELD